MRVFRRHGTAEAIRRLAVRHPRNTLMQVEPGAREPADPA